jgi:Tetracyclin repressor-like, C-terminal domain
MAPVSRGIGPTDVLDLALPLWSLVHGVASLLIDGAFERKGSGVDLERLIDQTTRRLFAGLVVVPAGAA